ncbi:MAG: chemotaxis protein CheX [Planctomycetota bacterium]
MGIQLHQLASESLDEACQALIPPVSGESSAAAPDTDLPSETSLCRAAVLGFAGDKIQGTLGIAASETGLIRVFEAAGGTGVLDGESTTRAEDSLAELSNLILGRLKRAWLRKGIEITLATPLVIRGLSIEVRGGAGNCWTTSASENGSNRVTAWLDLHCDESFEVSETDLETDMISEGETLLF